MSEEKKKRSKKTIKIILIIAAAAALVLAAVYTLVIKPAQSEDKYIYKESKAVKGNLVKGIMESGTVTLTTSSVDYDLDIEETETEEESSSDDSDDDSTSTHYLEIENVSVTPGQRIAEGDELFSLSQNSIKIPPTTSVTATTSTLSSNLSSNPDFFAAIPTTTAGKTPTIRRP